jgi:hypothetical protein
VIERNGDDNDLKAAGRHNPAYSFRIAISGFTRAARSAGSAHALSPTPIITRTKMTNVAGSRGAIAIWVALLASYIPARRTSSVAPMQL